MCRRNIPLPVLKFFNVVMVDLGIVRVSSEVKHYRLLQSGQSMLFVTLKMPHLGRRSHQSVLEIRLEKVRTKDAAKDNE